MAQQITIDIVAETKKLASGINDANGQIEGMSTKLKGVVAAAGAAASAFVLKQGVTFLKQGIDEAKEAQETMRAATSTFGEGSAALAKITEDADKFGKALAVDNDELIALATQLGSRLPKDVQASSVELVKIFKDIEAFTGGAVSAESASGKLAKAFADGVLKGKELQKIFPGLEQSVYDQAEALSTAGNNQAALNLLTEQGAIKYDNAAAKNATSTQKFEVALANFKEELGGRVLPILEKGIDFLTRVLDAFDALPGPVQNVTLGLLALVAVGGPLLGFLASAKTSMATLGLISSTSAGGIGAATIATNLFSLALRAIPIFAIIAAIVLLVKNWDTITEVVGKVIDKVKEFAPVMLNAAKNLGINLIKGLWSGVESMLDWLKEKFEKSLVGKLIGQVTKLFGIKSPSVVFAGIGEDLVRGLAKGIDSAQKLAGTAMSDLAGVTVSGFQPQLAGYSGSAAPIMITINAGVGTDPYALGREVNNALTKYGKVSSRIVRG